MSISDKILKIVFNNNPDTFCKAMWRQTHGSRKESFAIVREYMKRYGYEVGDFDIDNALAEFNGGCEIEWLKE